uniref:Uncharacterized protein n=2 Tax=Tetranychus urticae TaxID=32264 RepID=T1JYT5_TETUR
MIVPHFWTPLHDNVITWFALIEGFLLPISLYLTDDNFRDAVKLSFRRHRSGSCHANQEKYKPSSGMINKPGFTFHYNDFVLIDKPYLGLMKSSEAKRSPSTLNLVSSSRSPYPGRHSTEILSNQGKLQSNNRVNGSSNIKPSGLFGLGNHSKGQLARKSSHLSYIMSAEFCKKQQQSGFSYDSPSGKRFGPFFTNHNSTLNSNLTRSDDSMRKEKLGSSIARLSPMAWSVNGDNWHFSLVDRKLASAMELNDSNEVAHNVNDDDGKGRLIDKLSRKRKGESKDYSKSKDRFGDDVDDDGEHIYATLKVRSIGDSNSDYGCKEVTKPAVNSMVTDNSGFDDASISRLSFTTNANDDFEFHDTRESGSTIYSKPTNFGKMEEESGDSTSSGEDVSIITSDSCSSSDSDSDNHFNHQHLQSQIHLKGGINNFFSQIPIAAHQNRRHYSSQMLPGPNYHVNHLQMDKGNFYANKTANITAANPMLGYNRNKSRSISQITNPNGGNLNDYASNNKGGEEKRRGWQFFSASDLHSLENKGNENGQLKQDAYFINPLNSNKMKSQFDGHAVDGAIGSRRTMSETNLTPAKSISQLIQQQQQQQQQQLIYGSRDAGLYQLTRSTHNRIHLPFDPNYPHHLNQQHDTNTSISTNSSVNSSGIGDHNKRFANLIMTGANGDRRLERISSFSKNRPRIRAQKYQLYRRAAKRQDSIKELSVDYRRNCVGSRLSLTQQDLMSGPSEQLGAFVSVKSMPDLTINSYLPIYNQLSSSKK